MQSFELLGGKYQQGEQILPGVVQTFRSYEVPTGRPVFIHRIASNNPAAQEIADLLSAGLVRSPAVRKMLVDVYETEPYRFIVTEPARQCVPLRDWLEREADEGPAAAPVVVPVAVTKPLLPAAPELAAAPEPEAASDSEEEAPAMEPPPDAASSEFGRLFQEALAGKRERSRRQEMQQQNPVAPPPPPKAAVEPVAPPAEKAAPSVEEIPVAAPPPAPEAQRAMFSQVAEVESAGKSTLIIFLVVLGVLVALLVMFVVVFVKR